MNLFPSGWHFANLRIGRRVRRSSSSASGMRIGSPDTLRVLDLCTGTGSNLRYLIDRLPGRQQWLVVDRDARLLDELLQKLKTWAERRGCSTRTEGRSELIFAASGASATSRRVQMDLDRLDADLFAGRNLVTASALLDLVSESWLQLLASRCRDVGATALFTLTYDGRSSCDPVEPEDDMVRALMNVHQKTDKGLGGPAEGPDAWSVAEQVFKEAGYRVERAPSDWSIAPSEQTFQRMLIEGWARAAREIAPRQSRRDRRLAATTARACGRGPIADRREPRGHGGVVTGTIRCRRHQALLRSTHRVVRSLRPGSRVDSSRCLGTWHTDTGTGVPLRR